MADRALSTPRVAFERRDEVQFLDVRQGWEWEKGRIQQAVHIPLPSLLAGGTGDLDPDRPVVAYCTVGARSEVAMLLLRAKGFDAHNLEGGAEAWVAEGLPFEGALE